VFLGITHATVAGDGSFRGIYVLASIVILILKVKQANPLDLSAAVVQ
jgi:hypothetical protein